MTDNTNDDDEDLYYKSIEEICREYGIDAPSHEKCDELQKNSSPLQNMLDYTSNIFGNITKTKIPLPSVEIPPEYVKRAEKSLSTHRFFTFEMFNSIRGAENIHIYFWVGLDLAWMLDDFIASMLFGSLALFWIAFMAHQYVKMNNTLELYICIVNFMWIFANVLWCYGDLTDNTDIKYSFAAGMIMSVATFLWIVQRYWLVPNTGILKEDAYTLRSYIMVGLRPRFRFLGRSWKEYEHLFIFSWLLLDISWAFNCKILWIFGVVLSIPVCVDMTISCFLKPYMVIDSVHYLIQFIWLVSNICWSSVEIWTDHSDSAKSLDAGRQPMRVISAWLLLTIYFILFIMYFVWITLNYTNCVPNSIPIQLKIFEENELRNKPKKIELNFYHDHQKKVVDNQYKTKTFIDNPMQNTYEDNNANYVKKHEEIEEIKEIEDVDIV